MDNVQVLVVGTRMTDKDFPNHTSTVEAVFIVWNATLKMAQTRVRFDDSRIMTSSDIQRGIMRGQYKLLVPALGIENEGGGSDLDFPALARRIPEDG